MKRLLPVVAAAIMASCAGYFDAAGERDAGRGVQTLALADGSGYISTDNHNEITPYLYRDTNSGRAWLFFASDRDGNYDIYYAEMFPDGKFARPVKMDTVVNSSDFHEYSPAVFFAQYNESSYGHFMVLIRSDSSSTNVLTFSLNPDFSVIGEQGTLDGVGDARVSLKGRLTLVPTLLRAVGEAYWEEWEWNAASSGDWMYMNSCTLSNMVAPVFSVDGFMTELGVESWVDWFIISVKVGGSFQIYAGAEWSYPSGGEGHNYFPVPFYTSSFNDKDPFVDVTDFRVYFASDRYRKNNYDLYRYNILTYDKYAALPLDKPEITNVDGVVDEYVAVNWTAVLGAAGYRVFRSTDYGNTYDLYAVVNSPSYVDSNVAGLMDIYYKVQAFNSLGVSGVSWEGVSPFIN